jgi:acetyl-CoA carboxylase, biotin carboxylase subunit
VPRNRSLSLFKKILIANRGEIAVRIVRCCREMGIETVAVYSTADKDALHVQFADEAVCIGGPKVQESYLNMSNILTAAMATGCEAIHPGFGFLSENSEFARMTEACGITFIGPDADIIDRMGNKAAARKLMREHGIPIVPGSPGLVLDVAHAQELAEQIGYPLLVKAAAGGGGRGMRKVFEPTQLANEFLAARSEAESCFGDGSMYLEHLVINPKHIEFQILADKHGKTIHLGERDCSIQRRNQKMLEEAPSKALGEELRARMGATAVHAAEAAHYTSAGTIEFVVDEKGTYYFIEMNTRIQVEHPVTEMLTGVDLIREQIRIACGLPLTYNQEDIKFNGHAIECRIVAESPDRGFLPSPGTISFLHLPGGCGTRVDSALYNGCEMSPYYDSMIAKIITWAPTRLEAIRRMRRALEETTIEGIETNIDFEHLILFQGEFLKGTYDTGFLEANLDTILTIYREAGHLETQAPEGTAQSEVTQR